MGRSEYLNVRSDTVTLPTQEMLEAIARAALGDDNRGEDPTVCELEELAAHLLGKEAALLTTSGQLSNSLAVLAHANRGDEIIMEETAHLFTSEQGAISTLGGMIYHLVPGCQGFPSLSHIEEAIRPLDDIHTPRTGLICLENTHNHAGGTVISPEQTRQVCELAHRNNLPVHIDGARIFNASVALGVDARDLVRDADSICFCLSKGLSCPIGSVLVGSRDLINKARRLRKLFGGGMRQAGIIAAPGIVALNTMISRLREDHRRTRTLARLLSEAPGLKLNLDTVQTNMIRVDISELHTNAAQFNAELKNYGVEVLAAEEAVIRIVIHRHIEDRHIDTIADAIRSVAANLAKTARSSNPPRW